MLVDGKRLLITGVLTQDSIAYTIARRAQEEGAEVILSGFGRGLRITERIARRLPVPPTVIEIDATNPEEIARACRQLSEQWSTIDGLVHSIAFAPVEAMGGNFLDTPPEAAAQAFTSSAYSYAALASGLAELMPDGSAIVGLDFDAARAWPVYDWMGVSKAALEAVSRYTARDLGPRGIRSNLIASGPLKTLAAKAIGGADELFSGWNTMAPLGWNERDAGPVADACLFLLSDWSRAISGEIIHVDGGFHAVAAPAVDEPLILPPREKSD